MKLLVFSVFCLLGPDIFFCSGGGCGRSGYGHCLFAREPFWISVEAHKPAFSRLFLLPSSFFLSPANSSRKNLGKSALRSSCRASPALSPSGQATRPACRTRRKSSLTLFLPCLPLKLVSPSSSPYSSLSVPPSFSAAYLSRSVSPPSPSLLLSSSSSSAGIRFPSSSSSSPPFASTSYSSPPSLCALSLPCSSSSSSSPLREVFLQTASTFLHAPLLSPPAGDVPPHPPSRLLLLSHSSLGYSHEGEHSISGEDGKPDPTRQRVKDFVSSAPVVLFMKGTPEFPQCGFSRAIVQLLELVRQAPGLSSPSSLHLCSLPVCLSISFFGDRKKRRGAVTPLCQLVRGISCRDVFVRDVLFPFKTPLSRLDEPPHRTGESFPTSLEKQRMACLWFFCS